jgi:hypothetical protein
MKLVREESRNCLAIRPLLDHITLEALDECDYVALFGFRHLEPRQGRSGVSEENAPVALADLHAAVGQQHFSDPIVEGVSPRQRNSLVSK